MMSERFLTYARVLVHVLREEDLEDVVQPILERYPRATMSEVRHNTREPLEGGCHVIVYLKKSDLKGGGI